MITKNSTIGEVIDACPAAVDVLLRNGIHCIGCSARQFETIEHGLKVHGFNDKEIEKIVAQLNKISLKVISVTENAAKKLKEIMRNEKKQGCCLRVQAANGKYGLDFEKTEKKGDTVVKEHGLTFIVDAEALPKVRGAKIDWIESPEPGFSIRGPRK